MIAETLARHPGHFRQLGVDLFEDLLIAGDLARLLLENQCERPQQIGTADDANQRIAFHNGHAFDAPALRQLGNPVKRSVRGHSDDVLRHDLRDFAPVGSDIFAR